MNASFFSWDGELTHLQEDRGVIREQIKSALQWLKDQYAVQGWQHVAEPEDIVESVMEDVHLVRVGKAWIGFDIVTPWFMTKPVVSEEFVSGEIELATVVAVLEAVGREFGIDRLAVGTRAAAGGNHLGLARLYQRQGLAVSALELTKEIV